MDLVVEVLVGGALEGAGRQEEKMCLNWFKGKKEFDGGDLTCPRCNKVMEKLKKFDVVIDHCKKCGGMWLDDKEIEKLYGYYKEDKKIKKVKTGKK